MTVQSEVVPTMVELTLGELFGLTDPDARQKKMMVQRPPSPMAPATDDSTFFRLEDILDADDRVSVVPQPIELIGQFLQADGNRGRGGEGAGGGQHVVVT